MLFIYFRLTSYPMSYLVSWFQLKYAWSPNLLGLMICWVRNATPINNAIPAITQ